MALTKARASVIIFSWAAGVMYSTLFTMPYLLIAHYHAQGTVSVAHIPSFQFSEIIFLHSPNHEVRNARQWRSENGNRTAWPGNGCGHCE